MDAERMDLDATLSLPPTPRAAREARRFITRVCSAADIPEELCQTAALLVSELVTNAVIHGRTSATLHVQAPPPCLRVSVQDLNPKLPAFGPAPALDRESGRGLRIVAALASRWGVSPAAQGKEIWFELDLPADG